MRNCDIFNTEETLKAAWEKRKEIIGIDKGDNSGFIKWACWARADIALNPAFAEGTILVHCGKYVVSKGPIEPHYDNGEKTINHIKYQDPEGKEYVAEATDDNFKPAKLPPDLVGIVRSQLVKELREACPVVCTLTGDK